MRLDDCMKRWMRRFFRLLPMQNVILLESRPICADNTKAVFDEMLRREWNKKYRLIWLVWPEDDIAALPSIEDAELMAVEGTLFHKLHMEYLYSTAKAFVSCNRYLSKRRPEQYYIDLAHGGALKDCAGHYVTPGYVDDVLSFSTRLMPHDAANHGCDVQKLRVLGFPRNDILFGEKLDISEQFSDAEFSKLIYWMPTYRQMKGGLTHSDISIPVIHDEVSAQRINNCARENHVLILVKPHFAQDVSRIKALSLSNLRFIDDAFLKGNHISNYELLRSADALLSDYSSVYYDYLLLDRPIGLCWEDFEEYSQREGFRVNPHEILAGGEKIDTADDLCGFISRIAAGEDLLQNQRRAVRDMIHDYPDAQSAKRVVDYLEQKISSL